MALFTIKARSNGSNIVGPVWTLRSNMLDGLGWSLTLFKVFNQHSLTFSLAGSKSWPAWYIPKSNIAGWCWIRLNTPAFNTDQTSSNTTQQCWIMFEQYVWFVSTGLYCSRGDVADCHARGFHSPQQLQLFSTLPTQNVRTGSCGLINAQIIDRVSDNCKS